MAVTNRGFEQPRVPNGSSVSRMRRGMANLAGDHSVLKELGIGTNEPDTALHVLREVAGAGITLERIQETVNAGSVIGKKSRGTYTARAAVVDDDVLLNIDGRGFVGTTNEYLTGARIQFEADGTPSDAGGGAMPARILFRTAKTSGSPSERMRIDADGNVGIGTTAPGALLEVAGQVKITGGSPALNKVLTSDAAGLATWETAAAGGSQNLFETIAVSGQSNVVADSTTDTLTLVAGSNVTITTDAAADSVTIASTDTNTQLSTEQVQDIVGAMFSSNTETRCTVTYQDGDGTIDVVVDDLDTNLTTEAVQDIVGAMFSGNTETRVSVTYDDADGTIDVVVDDMTADTNTMGSGFVLEDGDGTEVTITENKEVKFVEGTGIDINWTDTSTGSDADPYDLTFTCNLEGTELSSTGEAGGSKFLREDGDGTCSWQAVSGETNEFSFKTISVSGQDNIVADTTTDTLTLAEGLNVTITTTEASDTITIASTNTTYTAGDGLDLTGTTFSTDLKANGGVVIEGVNNELAVDLGALSITGTLAVGDGGTGQTTYTNGQLLIGNTIGNTLAKATLTAGSNVSITNGSGTITIASTDTNTQLSTEQVQDIVGAMFSSNTETRIAATYQDGDGTIDLVVDDMTADTNTMGAGFVLEDGDGTEVTITENKEVKFIEGGGIDINWTDVSTGSDADPYDLTFTVSDTTVAGDIGSTGITPGDTLTIAGGTNVETDMSGGTLTITSTDTNTQLSTEAVQDIVGAMFSSNTETRITATYEDGDGTIDLVVDDMTANTQLSTEQVQDIVGAMFSSNTETRCTVTYQDADGTIDVVVDDLDTNLTAEAVQDIVGAMFSSNTETRISATYEDGDGTIDLVVDDMTANTQLSTEQVQDIVGAMFSSNTETRISATYQDGDGTIDLVVDDMTADTQPLTTEAVQDIVGAMFSSNTETRISATYEDGDGTIDLVVDDMSGGGLNEEQVQDVVGAMFSSNTETRVSVTYDDADGTIDVVVDDMTADTQLTTEAVQDIVGAMFSSNTETRISATYEDGDGTIDLVVDDMTADTQLTQEQVEDFAGALVATGGTKTGITVTYQDTTNDMDFVVSDLTVAGDTGSTGMTPGDTLTIAGGANVSTSMFGDTLTIESTYTAGNGLALSGTTFSVDDPINLSQLTEATDATDDKILLWDESASLWKYMTLDDLQDSIDTTGGGSSEWTDLGAVIHPTETGDDVVVGGSTVADSARLTSTKGGVALSIQNTTDAASNQVAIIHGGNRATPADGDEGYISFDLDDSNGAQAEFARLTFESNDVTSTTKDGEFRLSVMVNNTLTDRLTVNETGVNATTALQLGGTDVVLETRAVNTTGSLTGGGDLTADRTLDVADGGIGTAELAADAVTSAKIAADAVGSSEIAADAVGSSEIAANAVGDSEIASHTSTKVTITSKGQLNSSIAYEDETNTFTLGQVIDGTVDENQLRIQSHSTQTSNVLVIEDSGGADQLVVNNAGRITMEGGFIARGTSFTLGDTAKTATFQLASGGNNFNFRNTNANKTLIFDYPASGGDLEFRTHNGSSSTIRLSMDSDGKFIHNPNGTISADFQVQGDTDSELLFVDAGADRIGVSTNSPRATLDVRGGLSYVVLGKTADYTLVASDHVIYADAASGSVTITLPAWIKGRVFEIYRKDSDMMNMVTVSRAGTDTFHDGSTTKTIGTQYNGLRIIGIETGKWMATVLTAS